MKLRTIVFHVARGCFVLFALLVVAAILIPTIGNVYSGPVRTANSSNLSQIARTYVAWSNEGTSPRNLQLPPGSTTHDAAFILAQQTDLNDASLYFITRDPLCPNPIPKSVIDGNATNATGPNPDFAHDTLSIVMVANMATDAPAATTPFAWTRGLQTTGTWSADSPYNGTGGHIVYLDGHVEWQDKLDPSDPSTSLVVYPGRPNAGHATSNILEALPPGAVILSAYPKPAAK